MAESPPIRVGFKRIDENRHPVVGLWRGELGFVMEPDHAAAIAGALVFNAFRCLIIDGLTKFAVARKLGPECVRGWELAKGKPES